MLSRLSSGRPSHRRMFLLSSSNQEAIRLYLSKCVYACSKQAELTSLEDSYRPIFMDNRNVMTLLLIRECERINFEASAPFSNHFYNLGLKHAIHARLL